MSGFRTSEWRVAGHRNAPAGTVGDVEGASGHHCCHHRGAEPGRGGPPLRGLAGLGVPAAGPLPGRGRGGVRAAVPAAEDLTERNQRGHGRADHLAAQGAVRAGPGRRAAHHRLAPAAPSPGPGVPATVSRYLARHGLVTPDPAKRPKSSYLRFAAELPNECWQSDFTHYRLANGTDTEILTWIDDHSRYALSVTAHARVTGPIVLAAFRAACTRHGIPASTLTDNGMVFTTRLAGGGAAATPWRSELRRLGIRQKNGKPNHPQTQGKVERFQQTLKNWLRPRRTSPPPSASCSPCWTPSPLSATPGARTAPCRTGPPPPPPTAAGPKRLFTVEGVVGLEPPVSSSGGRARQSGSSRSHPRTVQEPVT